MPIRAEDPNIIYEVADRLAPQRRASERDSPARYRPFVEGAVSFSALDDGMRCARHLGGNRSERFAPEIGIVRIPGDIARIFIPEIVLLLADRDQAGHPERPAKPCVAVFRQFRLSPESAGLMR